MGVTGFTQIIREANLTREKEKNDFATRIMHLRKIDLKD